MTGNGCLAILGRIKKRLPRQVRLRFKGATDKMHTVADATINDRLQGLFETSVWELTRLP
jgi:hypothetical protein